MEKIKNKLLIISGVCISKEIIQKLQRFFLKGIKFGEDKIIINNLLKTYILLRDIENSDIYFKKAEILIGFLKFKYNKAKYLILKVNSKCNKSLRRKYQFFSILDNTSDTIF